MCNRPGWRKDRALLQVCCAVQALHLQQPPLAHRDVKPHNVLIRRAQPDSEAASRSASSAASSGRRAESQLKSNGESEPLAGSHAGHTRSYHAVLMVGAPAWSFWTLSSNNFRLPGVEGRHASQFKT